MKLNVIGDPPRTCPEWLKGVGFFFFFLFMGLGVPALMFCALLMSADAGKAKRSVSLEVEK